MNELAGRTTRGAIIAASLLGILSIAETPDLAAATDAENLRQSDTDMPAPVRAIHFVTLGVSTDAMKALIDRAAGARFNVIILGFGWRGSTKLNSIPWADHPQAWTREQVSEIASYARKLSIEVVPHIPLLTKQHIFLGEAHPEFLYNAKTYDPLNDQVYEIIFDVLNEIIELTSPLAIHIGHDELYGSPNRSKHWQEGENLLRPELFLLDVERIYSYLSGRNIDTWMWGDMLIAEQEFPNMNKVALLGGVAGYGAELRQRIPKEIVICDWHYRDEGDDFQTINVFHREGFRVLGATWKKEQTIRDFSRYAAHNGADGMIATTWFHTREKGGNETVNRIIDASGKAFFEAFPDGR